MLRYSDTTVSTGEDEDAIETYPDLTSAVVNTSVPTPTDWVLAIETAIALISKSAFIGELSL